MLNDRLIRWFSRTTEESGGNFTTDMPVFLASDIGLVREENQDRVALMRVNSSTKPFVVIALVDGMGGMRNGSECAVRTMSAFLNAIIRNRQLAPRDRLEVAANTANDTVYEYSKGRGGATLSAILVSTEHTAVTLNVGDSRIYATVDENSKSRVARLTVDDSLEEVVGGQGKELLQFIGMGEGLKSHIKDVPNNVKRLLITSDGIHFVRHETLSDVLLSTIPLQELAENLITLAKWGGAPDNASLAVTLLPELIQSLSVSEETGIEIWDPFSTLHVMWIKQDQGAFLAPEYALKKAEPIKTAEENKSLPDKEKPGKKARKSRSKKKESPKEEAPQLTFEINSKANQRGDSGK